VGDDSPGPSSLPIVRHRLSASTSFVLATLRALHIDPSLAVTKSAMIEKGRSSPGRGSSLGPIEHVLPDEGTTAADPSIDPHSCREAQNPEL
jgi:hypothetical protein